MEKKDVLESELGINSREFDFKKIYKIPVNFTVEIGSVTIPLQEIFGLKEGDIVPLNNKIDDPFIIKVNGNEIAEGELVEKDEKFYIKIQKITSNEI